MDLVAGKKDADKGKGKGDKKTGKSKPTAAAAVAAKKGKVAGMKALEVAQQSTASLGRCVCVFVIGFVVCRQRIAGVLMPFLRLRLV